MKKLILTASIVLLSQGAMAHGDLTAIMKSMGEQFKTVAMGLQSKNITDVEMNAVEQLQRDSAAAALIYPVTATDDAAKLKYSTWMAELVQAALKLEDTIEVEAQVTPMVLTESLKVFTEINEIRKKGHTDFKTEH